MDESLQFQNMDSWKGGGGSKFGLSFKQIILMHINRCVLNGSVEWHGGYWNEVGHNPTTRTYIHNSREVYCNSIKMLRALLLAYFDKKMGDRDEELKEEYDEKLEERSKDNEGQVNDATRSKWHEYKISWHIKLFEELVQLSKRLNFFEETSADEEF